MQHSERAFFSRRSIRLRGYDYRLSGSYFVTICTFRKACLFGHITNGQIILNDMGQLVQDLWCQIADKRRIVELDSYTVMPNHLHGIINILENESDPVPSDCAGGKTVPATSLNSGSLGAVVGQFKSAVTKRSRSLSNAPPNTIWQRNYYEHIIRDETTLNQIRKYIVENPARWADDKMYVE